MKDIIDKFLVFVCRFTEDASKEITKNQGYDDLDEFYLLDNKGVDTLCSIVRKPHVSGPAGLQAACHRPWHYGRKHSSLNVVIC